ncbi:MAG: hypothetical protein KAS07_05735, partial [Candidatus Pacebacteria bacterium]|nr:hypothetical protein [Candidatus Paceibacterota bacterium]
MLLENFMLHKKHIKSFFIFAGIFLLFQFAFAQSDGMTSDTLEEVDESLTEDTVDRTDDMNMEDKTSLSLYPPENFEVLREGEITLVLFDAASTMQQAVSYNIYRRCGDETWWLLGEISLSDCGGYACSYSVIDKSSGDTCRYCVSSVDEQGRESEKSYEKIPVVMDELLTENTDQNDTSTTDGIDHTEETLPTIETVSAEEEQNTVEVSTLDETLITTEDVVRHVASGKYIIYLRAQEAQSVEWSIYPEGSNTATYLGKATYSAEKDFWEYTWDTTTTPNGNYVLVPKIIFLAGQNYQDVPTYVQVKNEYVYERSEENRDLADIISEAAKEVEQVITESGDQDEAIKQELIETLTPYAKELEEYIEEKGVEEVKKELEEEERRAKEEMKTLLNIESSKLLRALDGDEEEFKRFENKVIIAAQRSIKNVGYIANEFGFDLDEDELEQLEKEVEQQLSALEEIIKKRREVLKERIGDDRVFQDSDNDGISNYDEVNIYNTDPFIADSDGDGFFDGAEILGGFNPNDPTSEAVLVYEEPRTGGYLEEDTFRVEKITVSEKKQIDGGKEDAAKIILAGNAPANSFV